ncbi:MAG: GIY-YIG nuclease family protein, partial [Sedimentibacter sp.]
MIDSMRETLFATIKVNSCMEITNQTDYKNAGIYMIYIDNFSDEKIIPFYIGQTKNFQRRYKEHLSEIMALNRLDCDYYNALLVNKFYDGSLKTCKMFKYMVDHGCSLKDFHMIILENVNELDKLDQKEQEYFKLYHPAFLGFNQMNTRLAVNIFGWSHKPETPHTEDEYVALCDTVSDDISNIYKYKEYGFTMFNFKWAFIKQLPYTDGKNIENIRTMIDNVNERLDRLREDLLCTEEKIAEARKNELYIKLKELRNVESKIFSIKEELINSQIIPKVQKLFEDNNIKSNTAYNDFVDSILYINEKTKNSFLNYLDKRKIYVNFYREFEHELGEKERIDCELRKYEIPI